MPKNVNKGLISPHVSALISQFVPEHIRQKNPKFLEFISAYLNYLEDTHTSGYYQNTVSEQRNLDLQEEQFLTYIEKEIGLFVPREYASSPRVFYNKISEIWRSKGSKESIELFFRLFLNDPVEIRFPWDRVLKPSDGKWIVDNKLRVSMIRGAGEDFLGKQITQIERFGAAKVEKVERRVYSDGIVFELSLVRGETVGEFVEGNRIVVADENVEAEIYRSVNNIKVINAGFGYATGERITLKNYDGLTFIAYISSVNSQGGITGVALSNFGAGNTPKHILATTTDEFYFEDFFVFDVSTNQIVSAVVPEFVVNTKEGFGAQFELEFGPIATTQGKYFGVDGQLSESIVIQDSKFYQKFSYEVVTNNPITSWLDTLKKTVHPAGTEVFANIRIFDVLDLKSKSLLHSDFAIPPNYEFGENLTITETSLGFVQTYAIGEDMYFFEDYAGVKEFEVESVNQTVPPLPLEKLAL